MKTKISDTASPREEIRSGTRSMPLDLRKVELNPRQVLSYRDQQALHFSGIQYPKGVMRKTWAYGYPREGDDIKIEEVLQKTDLELAVLSSFQVDPEWVSSKLNPMTKVVWVLQAKTEAEVSNIQIAT